MNEDANTKLRSSGLFVTPEKLAELFGKDPREFAARLADWKYHADIFPIEHASTELFPLFVFERGDNVRPNRAVGEVLDIFGHALSTGAIASWFVGLNSYLDDQCPKDLLDCDPAWVIEAARDEVSEINRT